MTRDTFDVLFLIARPAAGKSEVIDYLKGIDDDERKRRFHVGPFEELDDFPMLWAWFEEDAILEQMGHPRLHTDADGYFTHDDLWHVLIERLALEFQKRMRDRLPDQDLTTIVEFSRGSEHGGYTAAFRHFPEEMLRRGAILYIDVTYAESLRKNRRRYDPDRADTILYHGLSDEKMERLYREVDWEAFSAGDPEAVMVQGVRVPYAVFDNADDVTTKGGEALGRRLEATLDRLWGMYQLKQKEHLCVF
ncbi:MAG: hypothetical protein JXD18_08330 [Anaerolineae bacterium]|nr:hypothetical protein [Anaerolineae bacterium]